MCLNMKAINLIFIILLALPICFAEDWSEPNYNQFNYKQSSVGLGDNILQNIQNLTFMSGNGNISQNSPITYDFNGDGNPELLFNLNGILKFYKYNSSGQFENEKSIILTDTPATSFSVYNDELLVYASFNTLYVYNFSDYPNVALVGSKTMAVNRTFGNSLGTLFQINSVKCIKSFDDYCVVKGTGANIEVFNITNPASISSFNFTHFLLYNESYQVSPFTTSVPVGFSFDDNDIVNPKIATFCNNESGKFGIIEFYLRNGSIYRNNCVASTGVFVQFDPIVKDIDSDGLNDILYYGANSYAGVTNMYIVGLNQNFNLMSGFPISYAMGAGYTLGWGTFGNKLYLASGYGGNSIAYIIYNSAGSALSSIVINHVLGSTSFDASTSGSDFISALDTIYLPNANRQINLSTYSFGSRNLISSYSDGSVILFQVNSTKIFIHKTIVAPLSYPNITWCFRDVNYNLSLGDNVQFSVYQANNGVLRFGPATTKSDGCYPGPTVITTGIYNVSSEAYGYFPKLTQVNISNNGTQIVYINMTANSSIGFQFSFGAVDYTTGNSLDNLIYSLVAGNGTNPYNVVLNKNILVGGDILDNLTQDNYTIYITANGYATYQETFLLAGNFHLNAVMSQNQAFPQTEPVLTNVNTWTFYDGIDENGILTTIFNFNPVIACQNQLFGINISSRATDSNQYYSMIICDLNDLSRTFSANWIGATSFTLNSINRAIGYCLINSSNTYQEMGVYLTSNFLNHQPSDFTALLALGNARLINITINKGCTNETIVNIAQPPSSNTGIVGSVDNVFVNMLGAQNLGGKIAIVLFFIITSGLLSGGIVGLLTSSAIGFLYGFGITSAVILLGFVFVYPVLSGTLLFSLILLVIVVLTFRSRDHVTGGNK